MSCAIAGVGESRLGLVPGATALTLQAEATASALEDAGLEISDVDGLFCAGRWGSTHQLQVAEYLGIVPSYSDGTVVGGASFEFHLGHAAAAIQAGLCEVALVVYGSVQRSQRQRSLKHRDADLGFRYEAPYGMPSPVGAYALAASRHMAVYGTTSEQLAEVAVAASRWAELTPGAYRQQALTLEEVLKSRPISDPLRRLDCCLVSDGGGAAVVVSPRLAVRLDKDPVWLMGSGESHSHMQISQMPDLTQSPAEEAGRRAFEMSGLTPDDIDVAEIYDSFTITVIITLESLGFCLPGQGGEFVSNGRIGPGGEFPMNTNGGGLSYCHPGMYGIFLIIEAVRQLRRQCGSRQVPDASTALVSGTGGTLSSNGTCILGLN